MSRSSMVGGRILPMMSPGCERVASWLNDPPPAQGKPSMFSQDSFVESFIRGSGVRIPAVDCVIRKALATIKSRDRSEPPKGPPCGPDCSQGRQRL